MFCFRCTASRENLLFTQITIVVDLLVFLWVRQILKSSLCKATELQTANWPRGSRGNGATILATGYTRRIRLLIGQRGIPVPTETEDSQHVASLLSPEGVGLVKWGQLTENKRQKKNERETKNIYWLKCLCLCCLCQSCSFSVIIIARVSKH